MSLTRARFPLFTIEHYMLMILARRGRSTRKEIQDAGDAHTEYSERDMGRGADALQALGHVRTTYRPMGTPTDPLAGRLVWEHELTPQGFAATREAIAYERAKLLHGLALLDEAERVLPSPDDPRLSPEAK